MCLRTKGTGFDAKACLCFWPPFDKKELRQVVAVLANGVLADMRKQAVDTRIVPISDDADIWNCLREEIPRPIC